MKTVHHPGPVLSVRSTVIECTNVSTEGITLTPGVDLFSALERVLDERNAPSAFFKLIAGSLSALTVMTGGPGVDRPMTFHGPINVRGPASVVCGAGVIGINQAGERLSHCHAVFRDSRKLLVGGHLIKGLAVVDAAGLQVELMTLTDVKLAARVDLETQFPLLHPELA